MSQSGVATFDKTLQLTHVWMRDIGEIVGPDTQRQYHALRAGLHAVRDRIPAEEAFHLSAQLPMLVRGIFWEGYSPAHKPEKYRTMEEFLARVSQELEMSPPLDPEECSRAVFTTLSRHVSNGELDEVKQALPEPVRGLFPAA